MNKHFIISCGFVLAGITVFSLYGASILAFIQEQKKRLVGYQGQLTDFEKQLRSVDQLLKSQVIEQANNFLSDPIELYSNILGQVVPIINKIPDFAIRAAQQGDVKDMIIAMDDLLSVARDNIIKIRDRFAVIEKMIDPQTDLEGIYADAKAINKDMQNAVEQLEGLEDFITLLGI